MIAGQSAPRYEEMVALHPRSVKLRDLGLEYLISVVSLCNQVVTVCNQSAIGQLKTIFKELDVATYQSELLSWANAIKEQLSIEESRENSVARAWIDRSSKLELTRRKIKQRATFLDACSTFDYQWSRKVARKCGNATWFANNEEYMRWRNSPKSSVLLVTGKLGTGKTVLLANIVDDLFLNAKDHLIAYVFCRSDNVESQKFRTIAGIIARQLFELLGLDDFESPRTLPHSKLDYEDILSLFKPDVFKSKPVLLVIDGIDECDHEDRTQIMRFLRDVQANLHLKLCISYRLTASTLIRDELRVLEGDATLRMPEQNPDIGEYVQDRLESCLESGTLVVGDPAIIVEICHALEAGAQGM